MVEGVVRVEGGRVVLVVVLVVWVKICLAVLVFNITVVSMSHSLPNILSKGKVWGTLKTTTTVAVTNALKLVPDISPGSITVKRKYKTLNGTGRVVTKWWFILRGEEEVLQALENKWNIIAVQTAWRIEPVFLWQHYQQHHGQCCYVCPF